MRLLLLLDHSKNRFVRRFSGLVAGWNSIVGTVRKRGEPVFGKLVNKVNGISGFSPVVSVATGECVHFGHYVPEPLCLPPSAHRLLPG